jgi:GNAT superfamily N-acetyltransferase
MTDAVEIFVYQPNYKNQIIKLILAIQQDEFGLPITLEEQPDLLKIPTVYQQGNGNFWIALERNKVIGTIAAIDIGNNQLAFRKMFVDVNYRGHSIGVAKRLMSSLVEWSKSKNVRDIYLGTIDKFKGAHRFYEKNSFLPISKIELPVEFPIMEGDNIFYKLSLTKKQLIFSK